MSTKHTFKENVLRVVAVVGLIAVLLLGAWGIIQLAFYIPTLLSGGSASPAKETVSGTKPSTGAATTSTAVNTTVIPTKKTTPAPAKTTISSNTGAKYVASGRTAQLYGYPDLAVYMLSNPGSVRAGSRIAMQFVVENVGTNVAPGGWAFSASLPYLPASQAGNPVYTYQSGAQQALYPGDKIVYTLNYDVQYGNTYDGGCSGWSYPCVPAPTIYGGPGTCNLYGPCNATPYYAPGAPGLRTYQQTASVQADNYNQLWETNESNNYGAITYTVY